MRFLQCPGYAGAAVIHHHIKHIYVNSHDGFNVTGGVNILDGVSF